MATIRATKTLRADVPWHHVRRLILRVPVSLPADPTSARLRDDDRGEVVSVFEDERALSGELYTAEKINGTTE